MIVWVRAERGVSSALPRNRAWTWTLPDTDRGSLICAAAAEGGLDVVRVTGEGTQFCFVRAVRRP